MGVKFTCNYAIKGENAHSKSHRRSNKTPSAMHGKPAFKVLVRIVQETPKITQAIIIAFGCLPELEVKTLLL